MSGLSSEVDITVEGKIAPRANTSATTTILAVGVTERGPIGSARLTTSFEQWKQIYGGWTLNGRAMIAAVQSAYDNGAKRVRTSRVTHCTTPGDPGSTTSAPGELTIQSEEDAPTAGAVVSASQPYDLEPSWQLVLAFEAGGDQTIGPVTATAASVESAAEPFNFDDAQTIVVDGISREIDTGEFGDINNATAEEVKAILDPFFLANSIPLGCVLTTGNTKVKIQTTQRGSGASFTLAGTALAALGGTWTAGTKTGTGNVANVDAVTAAEVAAMTAPTNGAVSAAGGAVTYTSATTSGSSTAQIKNTSTAAMVTALGFDNAVHSGSDGTPVDTWTLFGKTDGAYLNDVNVDVYAASSGDADSRNVFFSRNGTVLERWFNLSSDPVSTRYFVTVLNDADTGSNLVRAEDLVGDDDPYTMGLAPAIGSHGPFTGGDDGLAGLTDADYVGAKASSLLATGIYVFALGEESGNILIVPGRATSVTQNGMITFCVTYRRERLFAILDPPADATAEEMVTYVTQTANLYLSTRCAAIYYPNVLVANPDPAVYGAGATIEAPPSGALAGLCARVAAAKVGGAFDHPAGPAAPYLPRGVLGFATTTGEAPSKDDRDLMFPYNINFVSRESKLPIFVDGARTLDMEGEFGSVGESLGVMFVQGNLEPALARCRHRGISQTTLDQERDTCVQFFVELTRAGAFASRDPKQAFVVDFGKIGEGLNLPSVGRARKTVGAVAIATAKPNEFIVVGLSEDTRAFDAELAAAQQV
jgi:hypothetical protein